MSSTRDYHLLVSQDNHAAVQAVYRGSTTFDSTISGAGSSDTSDRLSGTFYKEEPLDDAYPDPKNVTVNTSGTKGDSGDRNSTGPTPTMVTPYLSTKTWPALPVATDSGDEGSGSFPDQEYVRLLDATLLFYEAQRSGHLPPDQRVKWRSDSALLDGKDAGIDLTGGYYDAGDYLKFIFPLTFSLAEICYGGIDFFEGYVLADKVHHLDQMVRWGTDWLIKAHPNNNTLYVQVGVSEVDNSYWGQDTGIPTPRPRFFVSNLKPGTDVMADAAAAFASCSVLYREKFKDMEYAGVLQRHAEALFSVAETALPQQTYQTVIPAASCCYASTGYLDELAWGAAWMYRMTKDPVYAAKTNHYISEYSKLEQGSILLPITWDDKTGLVYILMAGLTQGTAEGVQWQALAEKFGNFVIHAPKPCAFTPGGMYYCYGYSGDDTSVIAANAAFAMNLLSNNMDIWLKNNQYNTNMTNTLENETRGKIEAYRSFALQQVRYLLGDNPEKTPYVVGVHPNSPTNPHSSLAAGGRSTDSIDTEPLKEAYILLGALVGGPDKNDRFQDLRSNWRQNEVALDYNAPFTSLMAYQVMTSHDPPPYATIAADRPSHGVLVADMPAWKLVLIIALVASILFLMAIYLFYYHRNDFHLWFTSLGKRLRGEKVNNHGDRKRNSGSLSATTTFDEKRRVQSTSSRFSSSFRADGEDGTITSGSYEKWDGRRGSLPMESSGDGAGVIGGARRGSLPMSNNPGGSGRRGSIPIMIGTTTKNDTEPQETTTTVGFFGRATAVLWPPPLTVFKKASSATTGRPYDLESAPGSSSSSQLLLARPGALATSSYSPTTPTTPMTPSGDTILQLA
ncbi:hypothetical protein EC957_008289 [Mortierella hygrophila]|uniref:Endoglucanase n=1 Tax=Mortierella hygrophila TaxID=979708 RepID=A0A9P6JYA6_9FUNG|nr:hypothetical protein EC957_008289 [Mortierella hygrophila]